MARRYAELAGSVIYVLSATRFKASVLARNRRGQSGLWGYGISGDLPIVLIRIRDRDRLDLVRQAVQAHAYWRIRGLSVDLVIWNEDDSVYRQSLQETPSSWILVVCQSGSSALVDKPGGIFVRRGEQMSEEDRVLLQTVARIVLLDDAGIALCRKVEPPCGRSELPIPTAHVAAPPALNGTVLPNCDSPSRPGVLQRPGRLQPRWARVHHHPGSRTDHARAVGERDCQCAVRHRGFRKR